MPKKLQFSQNPHYITIEMFKQKFDLLLNFASEHTCKFSFSIQVSPVNNLDFLA